MTRTNAAIERDEREDVLAVGRRIGQFAGRLGLCLGLLAGVPSAVGAQAETRSPPGLDVFSELLVAELVPEGSVTPPDEWGSSPYRVSFSIRRDLVAQGVGGFTGPVLSGTLDWSLMARHLMEAATTNILLAGWLTTEDGAEIMYEATGYAVPLAASAPSEWRLVAVLRFEAPDPPFEWLEDITGLFVGRFDAATGTAGFRAYVPGLDTHIRTNPEEGRRP